MWAACGVTLCHETVTKTGLVWRRPGPVSHKSGSRPHHNWSISQFLISQFIIISDYVMRTRIWKWRRHPGIKFNLLSPCYGRETWRATLWHEYYMSYWHVTHVTQEADFWHMTRHLDLIRVTGNEASSFLSRIRVNSPGSCKQRKFAKLIISCGVIINGTPATT